MALTVEEYNKAEEEAEINIPNRILEASRPECFLDTGYPIRVKNIQSLFRYLDVMHELRFEEDFDVLIGGGLTEEEFELFKEITEKTAKFSKERFGNCTVPTGALLRAIVTFRYIRILYPAKTATVLEIGPGSGYLAVLLALAGYRIVTSDITQAFYLWQNHLWDYIFGENLIELASDSRSLSDFEKLPGGTILHVPWWKYSILNPQEIKLSVEVITANHVFTEMQNDAFFYLLKLSCHLLVQDRSTEKMLIFEGTGGHGKIPMRIGFDVHREFCKHGFTVANWEHRGVSVLIPKHVYPQNNSLEAKKLFWFYNIKQHLTKSILLLVYAKRLLKGVLARNLKGAFRQIVEKYRLSSVDALKKVSNKKGIYINILGNPSREAKGLDNPITQRLHTAKKQLDLCVDKQQVQDFQKSVKGSEDLLNNDELWWKYLYEDGNISAQGVRNTG